MKRGIRLLLLSMIFSGLVAMAEDYSVKQVEKVGGKIAKKIQKTLKHKLKKAKKRGGLEAMAKYCAEESLKDIDAIRRKYGKELSVKRVSLRPRNPKNAPKKDEEKILEALDYLVKANAFLPKTIVQAHEDGSYKLYAPITLNSRTCKKCHGDRAAVDPKIVKYFASKYPDGKGYGYHTGDLRGAIVVAFPPPKEDE
ncbi:Tll0287-like domain-containing protein [Hydrogenimonas sp.]